jgi:hypothetical protein
MALSSRLASLVILTVVGWILLTGHAAASAAVAPCSQEFGSFSAGNWPGGCWRPYGPNSPFNQALPPSPRLAPASAGIVGDMQHYGYNFEGGANEFALTSYGRDPVYYPQPSDPVVTIECTYYWGPGTCQGSNGVVINRRRIHLPASAQPQDGADQHMTVIDQANGMEYDFDHATRSGDKLIVWSGGEIPIGPDSGTGLGVPGTAADFSTLAGVIRAPELASGTINHALTIGLPCTEGSVWPAHQANGFRCSQMGQSASGGEAVAPLGTRFQLNMTDAQIAAFRAPAWERTVMTAMAHYGMYVNDTSGTGDPAAVEMEMESDRTYTSVGGRPEMADLFRQLGGTYYAPQSRWILTGRPIPISYLRVIDPCVARGSCSSITAAAQMRARREHARLLRMCRRMARAADARRRSGHKSARLPAVCLRVLHAQRRRAERPREVAESNPPAASRPALPAPWSRR